MPTPSIKHHPVYWIGGSFSGGKSTTTRGLVERHELVAYHFDWHLLNDPAFARYRVKDASWFWMSNDAKMKRYPPAFPLAVEQITELSIAQPVVVEGPGLLPDLLWSHKVAPQNVIYLLPTPSFQRKMNVQWGEWVDRTLALRTDPNAAWKEWMRLDDEFANLIEAASMEAGYTCIRNDGGLSVVDVVALVERHFGLVEIDTKPTGDYEIR